MLFQTMFFIQIPSSVKRVMILPMLMNLPPSAQIKMLFTMHDRDVSAGRKGMVADKDAGFENENADGDGGFESAYADGDDGFEFVDDSTIRECLMNAQQQQTPPADEYYEMVRECKEMSRDIRSKTTPFTSSDDESDEDAASQVEACQQVEPCQQAAPIAGPPTQNSQVAPNGQIRPPQPLVTTMMTATKSPPAPPPPRTPGLKQSHQEPHGFEPGATRLFVRRRRLLCSTVSPRARTYWGAGISCPPCSSWGKCKDRLERSEDIPPTVFVLGSRGKKRLNGLRRYPSLECQPKIVDEITDTIQQPISQVIEEVE